MAQNQAALRAKVQGYIIHYAISINLPSLEAYVRAVKQAWLHWKEFEAMVKRWRWVGIRGVHKFF